VIAQKSAILFSVAADAWNYTDMKLIVALRNFANAPEKCALTFVSDSSCHCRMVGIPASCSDVLRSWLDPETRLPCDYLWGGGLFFLAASNIVSRRTYHVTGQSCFLPYPFHSSDTRYVTCSVEVAGANYHESLVSLIQIPWACTQIHHLNPRIKLLLKKLVSNS